MSRDFIIRLLADEQKPIDIGSSPSLTPEPTKPKAKTGNSPKKAPAPKPAASNGKRKSAKVNYLDTDSSDEDVKPARKRQSLGGKKKPNYLESDESEDEVVEETKKSTPKGKPAAKPQSKAKKEPSVSGCARLMWLWPVPKS